MSFDDELRRTFDALTERLQDDLRRHVQQAVETLTAEQGRQIEQAQSEAQALRAELARQAEQAQLETQALRAEIVGQTEQARAGGGASERTLEGIRAIGRTRSLSDLLDALVVNAAHDAARVALVTIRAGGVRAWRLVGFGPLDHTPPELTFDNVGLIATAVRTNATAAGPIAPVFAALPDDAPCIAMPIALGSEVVAVVYADGGSSDTASPQTPDAIALEILTQYAAKAIEALIASKVVRSLAGSEPASDDASVVADEDEDGARRYARLLVSEIKLYHEDSVTAGRRDRDLGARLGGEISRARALYEQRVPAHVRRRSSYFDEELVRTLADGDASLLEAM
jgi:hypothetical protein